MRTLWLPIATALLLVAPALAQKADPTVAVKQTLTRFLALNQRRALQSPEAKALYTQEALGWMAKEWGDLASPPNRVVLLDPVTAVGRTSRLGPRKGTAQDQYIFLRRVNGAWKIACLRSFAVTGSIHAVLQRGAADDNDPYLASMRLTVASDQELAQHWRTNRAAFERLRQLVLARRTNKVMMPEEQRIWKALGLRFLEPAAKGGVHFVAGAALESRVGYYYLPDNKPPRMDMDHVLWVEKLADRWYFYRRL